MYFIKTHVAEAGGMIETEYFETFFSEFLNDSRQLVASSSLVLENIIEQPEDTQDTKSVLQSFCVSQYAFLVH